MKLKALLKEIGNFFFIGCAIIFRPSTSTITMA
jgi:hypothetical protein